MRTDVIEACARAAHEANRAYCLAIGDGSQPSWDDAPEWQKSSARNGVAGALAGNTPEQSHASWFDEKYANGWAWGEHKDPERKLHPCMVPYADLPPEQRAKDDLFLAVVRAVAAALTGPRTFASGDVVHLKAGGLSMTVGRLFVYTPESGFGCECVWFDEGGKYHREVFDPLELEHTTDRLGPLCEHRRYRSRCVDCGAEPLNASVAAPGEGAPAEGAG